VHDGLCAGQDLVDREAVPLTGGGVPRTRAPMSSIVAPIAISAGIASLDHIRVEEFPEGDWRRFAASSSMSTTAFPFPS
jgi:hypothetical protein